MWFPPQCTSCWKIIFFYVDNATIWNGKQCKIPPPHFRWIHFCFGLFLKVASSQSQVMGDVVEQPRRGRCCHPWQAEHAARAHPCLPTLGFPRGCPGGGSDQPLVPLLHCWSVHYSHYSCVTQIMLCPTHMTLTWLTEQSLAFNTNVHLSLRTGDFQTSNILSPATFVQVCLQSFYRAADQEIFLCPTYQENVQMNKICCLLLP